MYSRITHAQYLHCARVIPLSVRSPATAGNRTLKVVLSGERLYITTAQDTMVTCCGRRIIASSYT